MSAADTAWFYRPQKGKISPTLARASHKASQRTASEVKGMKFATNRPYADADTAARKLIEIANSIEAVQDGRIHIELLNGPMLFECETLPKFKPPLISCL
jgi:hypothetical protein